MKKERGSAIQQASSMAMATEADWSELPNDLLNPISKRIDNEKTPFRNILTIKFPLNIDSINNKKTPFRNLSKHSLFLIKPPQVRRRRRPWLLRITQNSAGKTQFHQPQHQHGLLNHREFSFFDFNRFSLLHLATNFICVKEQTKAIAVTSHGNKHIILGTYSGGEHPLVFKCGDENWKVIPIPNMSAYFEDICVFKGRPYAVDNTRRTITVGLGPEDDSIVQLVAESLVGGDIKFLVESKDDLLLANAYDKFDDDDDIKRARIDVFKLNEKEKKWVKLANLGDRVLFLGSLGSFSASASDLCVPKGNCVIIMDNIFAREYPCVYFESIVFDLDDGRLLPLTDYPEYLKLFNPPPKGIKRS